MTLSLIFIFWILTDNGSIQNPEYFNDNEVISFFDSVEICLKLVKIIESDFQNSKIQIDILNRYLKGNILIRKASTLVISILLKIFF